MLNCHNNLLVLVGARWFTRLSRLPLNSLLSARPSSATRVSGSVERREANQILLWSTST